MKKTITLLFSIVILNTLNAQVYWTNLNAPNTARYYAISHNSSKMFGSNGLAGTGAAQFYYKQGAGTWNPVSITGFSTTTSFNNMYCTSAGNLIVTGSQGANGVVYRSTDNGSTWAQSTYSLVGFTQGIIEDASGNIYIYKIGGTGVSFVKSTDGGATFSAPNPTLNVNYMAVTGNTLYAVESGVSAWNVHKSTDGGVTWSLTGNNLSLTSQSFVRATPNGNIYIDTQRKSTNGGTTWSAMTTPPAGTSFFVDMANNYYVANEPTNLYMSSDAGSTYTDVVGGLNLSPSISLQYKISTNDGKMYVSTTTGTNYSLYIFGSIPTGLESSKTTENELKLYPNPSNGIFTCISSTPLSEIKIYNALGEMVYVERIYSEKTEINLTSQPKGVYFYQLTNNKQVLKTGKIIVE